MIFLLDTLFFQLFYLYLQPRVRKKNFLGRRKLRKQEKNFLNCRKLREAGKNFSELPQAARSRKKIF